MYCSFIIRNNKLDQLHGMSANMAANGIRTNAPHQPRLLDWDCLLDCRLRKELNFLAYWACSGISGVGFKIITVHFLTFGSVVSPTIGSPWSSSAPPSLGRSRVAPLSPPTLLAAVKKTGFCCKMYYSCQVSFVSDYLEKRISKSKKTHL